MFLFSPRSSEGLRRLQLNMRTLNWKYLPKLWRLLFATTQHKLLLAKLEEMPKLGSTAQISPAWEAQSSFSCPAHIGCLALASLRWDTASAAASFGSKEQLQQDKCGHLCWSQAKPAGLRSAPNTGGCPNPALRNAVLLSQCSTRTLSALPAQGFKHNYPKIALWSFPDAPGNECKNSKGDLVSMDGVTLWKCLSVNNGFFFIQIWIISQSIFQKQYLFFHQDKTHYILHKIKSTARKAAFNWD